MSKFLLLAGASIVLLGSAGAASAADCGGSGFNRVACDCGDTLTRSTTLRRSDPVVNNVCTGDGLVIGADRITLNCAGLTLTGDQDDPEGDEDDGIDMDDRSRVTVSGCHITGFTDGIDLDDSSDNRILRNVVFENRDDGLELDGDSDRNFVRSNKFTNHGQDGIDLDSFDDETPDHNTIEANFISDNNTSDGGDGIEDCDACTGNKYLYNVVQKTGEEADGENGIRIVGSDNVILGNRGSRNASTGLLVLGEDNKVSYNSFSWNGQNGICVEEGNRNLLGNSGLGNIGANVVLNASSCPVGIAANGVIASAALTASDAVSTDDDD